MCFPRLIICFLSSSTGSHGCSWFSWTFWFLCKLKWLKVDVLCHRQNTHMMKHQTWCHANLGLFLLSIRVLRVSLAPLESPVSQDPLWVLFGILLGWFFLFCSHVGFSSILGTRCTFVDNYVLPLLSVPFPVVLSHWHTSHSVLKGHFDFLGSHGSSRSCWPPWKERRWCKKLTDHLL